MGNRDLRTTTQLADDLNKTSVTIISDKAIWSSDVKVEGMSQFYKVVLWLPHVQSDTHPSHSQ